MNREKKTKLMVLIKLIKPISNKYSITIVLTPQGQPRGTQSCRRALAVIPVHSFGFLFLFSLFLFFYIFYFCYLI